MASRKSRSYANPDYQAQIERYAPEQAYRRAVQDVNHRVVQYVQQAYRSDPRFLTDQGHIDRLTALMAPAVEAGQLQIADLTNAHLSTLFGVKEPPAPDLSSFARDGVSRTTELARPFWTAIKAAKEGKDFDAALAAGEARLSKMVQTDLQMAKVRQAREVLKAGHIQTYARVTGDTACWLCEIAATQVYYTEDLLPIHPSCVVSGTLVTVPSDQAGASGLLGSVEAATRQKFVGEIVELSTASGNFVRVTPNHPVLTDKGWIPAGLIRKGDNVFRSLRGERPVDGRPDVAQRPSRIEDVFAAASVTGRLLRVPTTAEDFHGDGSDNEVDVVWTASDLALPLDVLSVQQPSELCLMHAHGLGVPLVGQGAFDGLAGTRFAASRSNIRGGGDRGALLDGGAFVSQSGGSLRSARFNPTAAQFSGDGIASYAEQGRALIDRLAGKVERDSVIECRRVSFAGHVFNLQTAEGWYVADNIVLSNCNCSVKPIPDGGEADIRKGFTPDEIFAHATDQVKLMTGLVESDASLKDYQDLLAVREHGEIGPTLTWKHQNFTGPQDLPVPPSREVLEHQAFEAVKKTGGVTIDLAGNTPTDGFAYAPLKGTEVVVPQGEFSPKHIDDFINTHAADLARPGNHLGMWTQDGNVYLDVSRVGAPTAETLAKAQGAHQLAVYDLGNGHDINLGTVDNAGKYTAIGSPTGVLDQYRGEVARANEAVGAGRVPGVAARESAKAAAGLEWDGPPVVKPQKVSDSIYSKDWGAGNNVDYHWANNRWDEWSPAMRAGGREAQAEGYTGIKEMGKRKSRWDNPTEHELRIEGKEIVARAVRAEPSTEVFYRGMGVTQEQIDKLAVGQSISMPLSSFTGGGPGSKKYAIHFATESATGGVNRPKNAKPVLLQLQPGAKLADVYDHSVGFGQFDVTKVTPATSRTPRIVTIKQTSMIEADVAQGNPAMAAPKGKGRKPIPEVTIVDRPKATGKTGLDAPVAWDVEGVRVFLPDTDIRAAKDMKQAVTDMKTKFPHVRLEYLGPPDRVLDGGNASMSGAVMRTGAVKHSIKDDSWASRITVNAKYFKPGKAYDDWVDDYKGAVDQGFFPRHGKRSPAYATVVHEFGHSVDAAGGGRAAGRVNKVLSDAFRQDNPELYTAMKEAGNPSKVFAKLEREGKIGFVRPGGRRMDFIDWEATNPPAVAAVRAYKDGYQQWLEDGLSGYSFKGGQKGVGAPLARREALAEAFDQIELNPRDKSKPAKLLHDLMIEESHAGRPENWVDQMKKFSPFTGDLPTPAEVVAVKEATRGEKYLAKYQKQAEKLAKDTEAQAKREAAAAKKAAAAAAKAEKAAAQAEREAAEAKLRGPAPGETRKLLPDGKPLPDKAERVAILRERTPQLVANQEARYAELTYQEKVNGRRWYADQCTTAANQAIDGKQGFLPIQGVSVNVALSPQTKYPINTAQGARYLSVPRGEGHSAIVKMPTSAMNAMGSNADRADRLSKATTYSEVMDALHEKSDAKKLSNYFPSAWVKAHPEDIPDRANLFTVDTWAVRTMDHSQAEIRDVLKLPPGTRLSERQESRGELLLNSKRYGTHWEWSKGKSKWVELPNYRSVDMIGDDYDVFQQAGVLAASKAPEFAGTYESRLNTLTGRYETVLVDDKPSKWLPEDYQAALWGQIVPAAPPSV